jgi:non-specific serine/threonine protein kinase
MMMLAPVLSPHGVLTLARSLEADAAPALELARGVRLEHAFVRGSGHGLLVLGADEVGTVLPPTLSFWRKFAARYVTALCSLPGIGERSKPPVPIPADGELDTMAAAAPPMTGAEYLTPEVLADLWRGMDAAFDVELAQAKLTVQEVLTSRHPAWNLVGRVHFNLAENRKDENAPLHSLRPIRRNFRPRPRPSICRSARRCRNMPVPGTANASSRC